VSSIGSRRTSQPILGSRYSPERAMLEPGGHSIWLVCWIGSFLVVVCGQVAGGGGIERRRNGHLYG